MLIKKYGKNTLNEEKIRKEIKNKKNIFWDELDYEYLSEDFIREFADKLNWKRISMYQTLSEDFIRKFSDKVNWYDISKDLLKKMNREQQLYIIMNYRDTWEKYVK